MCRKSNQGVGLQKLSPFCKMAVNLLSAAILFNQGTSFDENYKHISAETRSEAQSSLGTKRRPDKDETTTQQTPRIKPPTHQQRKSATEDI